MQGADRTEYGASIIKNLAKELTAEYGKEIIVSESALMWQEIKT